MSLSDLTARSSSAACLLPPGEQPESAYLLLLWFVFIIPCSLFSLQWEQMQQMEEKENGAVRGTNTHLALLNLMT